MRACITDFDLCFDSQRTEWQYKEWMKGWMGEGEIEREMEKDK